MCFKCFAFTKSVTLASVVQVATIRDLPLHDPVFEFGEALRSGVLRHWAVATATVVPRIVSITTTETTNDQLNKYRRKRVTIAQPTQDELHIAHMKLQ